MLDPAVFKAYDVRGLYPSELDEAGAYAIGRAYVDQFEPKRIAVGRDMRLSAPSMARALIEGAADAGADVLDLGMVGTEMVYFAVGELGLDGGIMVTASHNPKDYTGMKIVRRGALPVGSESGLLRRARTRAVRRLARRDPRDRHGARTSGTASSRGCSRSSTPTRSGRSTSCSTRRTGWPGRCSRPSSRDFRRSRRSAGTSSPTGRSRTTSRIRCCRRTASSSSARPARPGADFGVAYDGDADRCFFVDDTGEFVPGDFTTTLFAESILGKEPGGTVIYDVRASWAVPEAIEAAGGVALVNRVGHAFIKQRMRDVDAVFAGEVSAHYYFRDFCQADSGVIPFLLMLELLSTRGQKLSELLASLRSRYFLTGEINVPVGDVPLKLQELKERFGPEGRVTHLDGLSVDAADWHMNVRPSNTEPLLRLNLEARSQELMEAKRDEVLAVIQT